MISKFNLTIYFVILFVLFSCQSKGPNYKEVNTNSDKPINVPVEKSKEFLFFNTSNAKIDVIKLDSTVLIAEISKTLTVDGFLFVLDKKSDTFFCFNEDGTIKWKYNKLGKGPEEHDKLLDFTIRDSYIYLYDKQFKLIKLGYDGKFILEKRLIIKDLDFFPDLIFIDPSMKYLTYNDDMGDKREISHKLIVLDSGVSKIEEVFLKKNNPKGNKRWINSEFPLQTSLDNLGAYYTEALNDTIYYYTKQNLKRKYTVDFGKNTTPESFKSIKSAKLEDFRKTNYGGNISAVFETDSLLSFKTLIAGHPYYHLYNKNTGKSKSFQALLLDNKPYYTSAEFIGGTKNKLYFLVEPDQLLKSYKYFKQKDYKLKSDNEYYEIMKVKCPIYMQLMKDITLYSNQIIVTVEFNTKKIFADD